MKYGWDSSESTSIGPYNPGNKLGLIAQEVEQVLPEVVKSDKNGLKHISYNRIVPVLIEAIKELKTENDSLQNELTSLESRVDKIESFILENIINDKKGDNKNDKGSGAYNNHYQTEEGINMSITDKPSPSFTQIDTLYGTKAIVLNQNAPNPFKEKTTITFQIPESVHSAKIVFIDNFGNLIKQVVINDRGFGELIVYAQDLSAGLYTYFLVADGKTIDTKKMMLTR